MKKSAQGNDKQFAYSALEVAKICGVVNQTAINWIKAGHLNAYKTPGGQFRVYPDDLVDFMDDRHMDIPSHVLEHCLRHVKARNALLIVDDDKSFNGVIAEFLRRRYPSLEVFQAYDGFDAGIKMADINPRCVILDLNLPGVDGISLCHRIKETPSFNGPEIIVVTAMLDEGVRTQCTDLGVRNYFTKPLNLFELVKSLEKVFF